jgi:hydrogenase maturation factor
LTVGRGISGAPGLVAGTCTREVSFFGFGVATGMPMTAVSFFDSSSEDAAAVPGLGFRRTVGVGEPAGLAAPPCG